MDGLNIATKAGESQANVLDWSGLNNNISKLYERSIQRAKDVRDTYDKTASIYGQMAGKVRPNDLPLFTEKYNKWKDAEMLKMTPEVQKDNKKYAQAAQESAKYFAEMQAEYKGSTSFTEQGLDRTKQWATAKGLGYIPSKKVEEINDLAAKSTWRDGMKNGYYDVTNWIAPKINFPFESIKKYMTDPKGGFEMNKEIESKTLPDGKIQKQYVTGYRNVSKLFENASELMKASPDDKTYGGVHEYFSTQFNELSKTQQGQNEIINTINQANALLPAEHQMPINEEHYGIASIALKYKPEIELRGEAKPTYEQKLKDRDRIYKEHRIYAQQHPIASLVPSAAVNPINDLFDTTIKNGQIVQFKKGGQTIEGYSITDPNIIKNTPVSIEERDIKKGTTERVDKQPDDLIYNPNTHEVQAIRYKRTATGKIDKTQDVDVATRTVPYDEIAKYYTKTTPKNEARVEKITKGAKPAEQKKLTGNKAQFEEAAKKKGLSSADYKKTLEKQGYIVEIN